MIPLIATLLVVATMPWLSVGLINRTRSLWTGRRGPPLLQPLYDVLRLLRKTPVYSVTTTAVFRLGPWVGLGATLASVALVPVIGLPPLLAFPFDFVAFAGLWALGRAGLILGALDTGSAFEGMGAAREATFSTILEPALLLLVGALGAVTGEHTLAGSLQVSATSAPAVAAWVVSVLALTVIVLAEGARLPVDDPATHLELTMVHEVMVLDHSGPELAAIHATSGLKLGLGVCLLAALLNPWGGNEDLGLVVAVHGVLCVAVLVSIGTFESLIARLQFRVVPRYLLLAVIAAGIALLATTWQGVPR